MSTDELEHSDSTETVNAATAGILALISLTVTINHTFKVYQDIFTADRASLSHQKDKGKINAQYKKATFLTLTTTWLYCILMLALAIQYNFSVECMPGMVFIEYTAFYSSKCGLYLTYILRLHLVYGGSPFGYKLKKLICLSATAIFLSSVSLIIGIVTFIVMPLYSEDTDNMFPYYCAIYFPYKTLPYAAALAFLTLIYDVFASIFSIVGFIIPLRKIEKQLRAIKASDDRKTEEIQFSFQVFGYKYKVIVVCASLSTLFWLLLFMVGFPTLSTVFYLIDLVVNPICLLLMTPYYPSNTYYEKLCCVCVSCCDRQRKSYQKQALSIVKSASTDPTTSAPESSAAVSIQTKTKTATDTVTVTDTGVESDLQ